MSLIKLLSNYMPGLKEMIVDAFGLRINGTDLTATMAEINAVCDNNTATAAEISLVCDNNTTSAAVINKIAARNTVTLLDGETGKTACVTNGVSAITKNTSAMTLAAPTVGDQATIRIDALESGSVVVTCAEDVTVDGTNNKMTFDAAGEAIVLAYKSPTEWQVVLNIGGVALSQTEG